MALPALRRKVLRSSRTPAVSRTADVECDLGDVRINALLCLIDSDCSEADLDPGSDHECRGLGSAVQPHADPKPPDDAAGELGPQADLEQLNRATQHSYTDSTRRRVIAVCLEHRVYESRVE
jgi:hypothetical protein